MGVFFLINAFFCNVKFVFYCRKTYICGEIRHTDCLTFNTVDMKRVLLVMAALIIGWGGVSAKSKKEVKKDLVGIWQQVNTSPKAKEFYYPVLKIIDKDGTFSTMFTHSDYGMGKVTQIGTFKVLNDSVYTETVKRHLLAPDVIGETYIIKFRFSSDSSSEGETSKDIIALEFEDGYREVWVRISDKELP